MKKLSLFIPLVALISLTPLLAQDYSISMQQGDTTIVTEPTYCSTFNEPTQFSIALIKHFNSTQNHYCLQLSLATHNPINLPSASRAYLVLDNDSVINLVIHQPSYAVQESTFNGERLISQMVATAYYPITIHELLATFHGIKRIRIEHESGIYEKFFSTDQAGAILKQSYHLINHIKY